MNTDDASDVGSPSLLILYGSQTGTGEELAERVGREGFRFGFHPIISPMDDYEVEKLQGAELICFISSTTGQGEEPHNMKNFWKFLLKRSLPEDFLSRLKFTVLGLGDSSYIKFNFAAKKLYKRLLHLGATPVIELHLADDQHDLGPDAVIDKWLPKFWDSIKLRANNKNLNPDTLLKPKFSTVKENSALTRTLGNLISHPHPVTRCALLGNSRVTAVDHFQDTRLISINLAGSNLNYDPGDVLMVQPSNIDESVEDFFNIFPHFKPHREEAFYVVPNWPWANIPIELSHLYPLPWTLEKIVRHYFDLQSIPKRYFFELLSQFTTSDIESEKLKEFSSAEGQQDLYSYCNRPKRNVLEVLQDFPHATENISMDYLFDLMRPIKPRAFSIASSMKALDNELQILVAVVKYQTKLKKPRLGLCSNWLANLSVGAEVPIWIEHGSFHFPPPEKKQPVIMVGPGTGVAPFRSFISERVEISSDLTLFFGCRYAQKDFYFLDEWSRLEGDHKLRLITAFSRDNSGISRVYVQHKIEEHGELLWDLIENHSALVFVAGNAKQMPIEVSEAFISVFLKNGCTHPESYMKHLVKTDRYQTEVWS